MLYLASSKKTLLLNSVFVMKLYWTRGHERSHVSRVESWSHASKTFFRSRTTKSLILKTRDLNTRPMCLCLCGGGGGVGVGGGGVIAAPSTASC